MSGSPVPTDRFRERCTAGIDPLSVDFRPYGTFKFLLDHSIRALRASKHPGRASHPRQSHPLVVPDRRSRQGDAMWTCSDLVLTCGDEHTANSRCCILNLLFDLVERCRVKAAVLFSIPLTTSAGVCWRWRSLDGKTDSPQSFICYHDCLENAQVNGYDVEAKPQRPDAAPTMRPFESRRWRQ